MKSNADFWNYVKVQEKAKAVSIISDLWIQYFSFFLLTHSLYQVRQKWLLLYKTESVLSKQTRLLWQKHSFYLAEGSTAASHNNTQSDRLRQRWTDSSGVLQDRIIIFPRESGLFGESWIWVLQQCFLVGKQDLSSVMLTAACSWRGNLFTSK